MDHLDDAAVELRRRGLLEEGVNLRELAGEWTAFASSVLRLTGSPIRYGGSLADYRRSLVQRDRLAAIESVLDWWPRQELRALLAPGDILLREATDEGESVIGWAMDPESVPNKRWWWGRMPSDEDASARFRRDLLIERPTGSGGPPYRDYLPEAERHRPLEPVEPTLLPETGQGAVWIHLDGDNSSASWNDPGSLDMFGDESGVLAWARDVPAAARHLAVVDGWITLEEFDRRRAAGEVMVFRLPRAMSDAAWDDVLERLEAAADYVLVLSRCLAVRSELTAWRQVGDEIAGGSAADGLDQASGHLQELGEGRAEEILQDVQRLLNLLPTPME